MNYILYLPFALLPSIIWLLFYLRKDKLPESNKMILAVFFYGMAAAVIAGAIEIVIDLIVKGPGSSLLMFLIYHLIVISLVEELAKYFVVRQKVLKNKEFDEPVDAMLYMIIAALGFAALENLLYLSPILMPEPELLLREAALVAGFRFVGATFLHALCSGLIGFFLAYAVCFPKKKIIFITSGIVLAAVLHGLFNISIIGLGGSIFSSVIILIIILSFLAIFVSFGFNKLKKLASICEIK